ncbi:MAG: hypothetical protein OEU92_04175 [Alphaproteobacteria bacterium]|nr:hypothetical protein [Alphaproteobacteria bacterium]
MTLRDLAADGEMISMLRLVAVLILLAGCNSSRTDETNAIHPMMEVTVASSLALDTTELNERILRMDQTSAMVLSSPIALVEALIGGSDEARSTTIAVQRESAERPGRASVTAIRDGFLDDSIRGDWHRFDVERRSDGSWKVTKAQRATRCWRSSSVAYSSSACP